MMIVLAIGVFLLGLIIGSFLNVCIYRIPEGKNIAFPPSNCMHCGEKILRKDLIPVLSYLYLGGKCRSCKEKISMRYPLVEMLTGITYVMLFMRYGVTLEWITNTVLLTLLIVVFFIDIDYMIIPNELVIVGIIEGILVYSYNIFNGMYMYDGKWWSAFAGILIGSGFLFLVAYIGMLLNNQEEVMGMGDVKIFIPIGIVLGWKLTLVALFLAIMAGAAFGLILIVFRKKDRKTLIPFGPFIVIGTWISLLYGQELFSLWYYGIIINV